MNQPDDRLNIERVNDPEYAKQQLLAALDVMETKITYSELRRDYFIGYPDSALLGNKLRTLSSLQPALKQIAFDIIHLINTTSHTQQGILWDIDAMRKKVTEIQLDAPTPTAKSQTSDTGLVANATMLFRENFGRVFGTQEQQRTEPAQPQVIK